MGSIEAPNILLFTADDMNWDAVGAFGCPVPGTTPNIDCLAEEGIRFEHGHVNISVCQPSRYTMMTGRYPHLSGGEGFYRLRLPEVPFLPEILRANGFKTCILGKVDHSTPYEEFKWDMEHDRGDLGEGRNPNVYYQYSKQFFEQTRKEGKPFFLMANSHDPHRPFFGNDREAWYDEAQTVPVASKPSRTFQPEEIEVPGFLPDLPEVRLEISEYYNSVRRCDDTVGKLMQALKETGVERKKDWIL